MGYLARIDAKDADAIGEAVEAKAPDAASANKTVEELCWDELRTCYDPEIPVNIVDLGLVYSCQLTPHPEGGEQVDVRFTLTAPGCGMGDVLRDDIRELLKVGDQRCDGRSSSIAGSMSDSNRRQLQLLCVEGDPKALVQEETAAVPPSRRTRGYGGERDDSQLSPPRDLRAELRR